MYVQERVTYVQTHKRTRAQTSSFLHFLISQKEYWRNGQKTTKNCTLLTAGLDLLRVIKRCWIEWSERERERGVVTRVGDHPKERLCDSLFLVQQRRSWRELTSESRRTLTTLRLRRWKKMNDRLDYLNYRHVRVIERRGIVVETRHEFRQLLFANDAIVPFNYGEKNTHASLVSITSIRTVSAENMVHRPYGPQLNHRYASTVQ